MTRLIGGLRDSKDRQPCRGEIPPRACHSHGHIDVALQHRACIRSLVLDGSGSSPAGFVQMGDQKGEKVPRKDSKGPDWDCYLGQLPELPTNYSRRRKRKIRPEGRGETQSAC
jgi:hypothetical protein